MKAVIAMKSVPVATDGFRLERRDGEAVLVDGDSVDICSMNPSAAALWELCDGETTVEEIVTAVTELASVPWDEAAKDIRTTFAQLDELGAVGWR